MRINYYSWKILTIVLFPLCVFTGWIITKSENKPQSDPPHLPGINTSANSEKLKVTPKPTPTTEKQTSFVVGDHRLTITESPRRFQMEAPVSTKSADLVSPNPVITDIGPNNRINTFSIMYVDKENGTDFWIPLIDKSMKIQVDKDPEKEVVIEWLMSAGGSDGIRCITVFDLVNNTIQPQSFIPYERGPNYLLLTNITTGQQYRIQATTASFQTEYVDLNQDNKVELLFYWYNWLQDESHFEPHYWNLQVYEMVNGQSLVAPWWNSGKTYETEEKLGFEKQDKDTIMRYYKELVNK